jgi:hypothetical protein
MPLLLSNNEFSSLSCNRSCKFIKMSGKNSKYQETKVKLALSFRSPEWSINNNFRHQASFPGSKFKDIAGCLKR